MVVCRYWIKVRPRRDLRPARSWCNVARCSRKDDLIIPGGSADNRSAGVPGMNKRKGAVMYCRFFVAFCLVTYFVGCATTAEPSLESESIRVATRGQVGNCQFIGTVTSRFGGNFVSMETNVHNCTVELRNKAADLGATHLVMERVERTEQAPWGSTGERCNNCVMRTGDAYRCRR